MADGGPGFASTGEGGLGGEELNQWNEVALTETLGMEGGRGKEGEGGRGKEGRKGQEDRWREEGRGVEGK